MITDRLIVERDLHIRVDYGQFYIYSNQVGIEQDSGVLGYMEALEDARQSGRFVGAARGMIDVMTPGQWNWATPLRVEVWAHEPEPDTAEWDHEVDLDLDVPDGRLLFECSGSGTYVDTDIPKGRYRVRVSGRGFTALGAAGAEGDDSYRLQLWPRVSRTPPTLRKKWPGWKDYS